MENETRGFISTKDLELGDMVKSLSGEFDRIYSFDHRDEMFAKIIFKFKDSGWSYPCWYQLDIFCLCTIPLLWFLFPPIVVYNRLYLGAYGRVTVVKKLTKNVWSWGRYTPFTTYGTILAKSIDVSSYMGISTKHPILRDWYFSSPYLTPVDCTLCVSGPSLNAYFASFCHNEMYKPDGISWRVSGPSLSKPKPNGNKWVDNSLIVHNYDTLPEHRGHCWNCSILPFKSFSNLVCLIYSLHLMEK